MVWIRPHGKTNEERNHRYFEGPFSKDGCSAGLRVFCDQLCVGPRRQHCEEKRQGKGNPDGPSHLARDLAHQCVDPCTQHIAEDEEEEEGSGNGLLES